MTMIWTLRPVRACAFLFSSAKQASIAATVAPLFVERQQQLLTVPGRRLVLGLPHRTRTNYHWSKTTSRVAKAGYDLAANLSTLDRIPSCSRIAFKISNASRGVSSNRTINGSAHSNESVANN